MRTFLIVVFVLLSALAQGGTGTAQSAAAVQGEAAGPAGDPEVGKAVWALGNTSCRNCHGGEAEGAWGPDLAGRNLTLARFLQAVRKPAGRMPAFVESQLSDREVADLVAYLNSLPPAAKPGPWRFEVPAEAPIGQQLAVGIIGCGQCHGPELDTPRHGAGEVSGDFEWFKRMVYEHTTAQREQWSQLDPDAPTSTPGPAGPSGRVRMGNYSRSRLPEAVLEQIWRFMNDRGLLVPLTGQLTAGAAGGNGVVYTLKVANGAVPGKGMTADNVTITLVVPPDSSVVSATGAGYQGVRRDEQAKSNVAVWLVPRLAPRDRQTFTITLSRAPAENLRGTIRYAKPAIPGGDIINIVAVGGRG
jgi:mono/diheme cytochrome c family protein